MYPYITVEWEDDNPLWNPCFSNCVCHRSFHNKRQKRRLIITSTLRHHSCDNQIVVSASLIPQITLACSRVLLGSVKDLLDGVERENFQAFISKHGQNSFSLVDVGREKIIHIFCIFFDVDLSILRKFYG